MTHYVNNFSSNSNRRYRNKTVLFSSVDLKRMTVESSKAKLISQLVGQDETVSKKFNPYLQGLDIDPTSYYSRNVEIEQQYRETVPTYQTQHKGQGLRWNPYVEINSEEESVQDVNIRSDCHCKNCTTRNCPSRNSSASTLLPNYRFKDNIMRFCDQCTMTRRLNDASCDVPTPTSMSTSTVSINVSNVGIPNNIYNVSKGQPPMLKNGENEQQTSASARIHRAHLDEAVRDTDIDEECHKTVKSNSIKSFFSWKKKGKSCEQHDSPRKTLYNEGISDVVTKLPYSITPANVSRNVDTSRSLLVNKHSKYYPEEPHAHGSKSKYHQYCKKMFDRPIHYADSEAEFARYAVAKPKIIRTTFKSDLQSAKDKSPSITLPRKVLTSERNINSYIEKRGPVTPIPKYLSKN